MILYSSRERQRGRLAVGGWGSHVLIFVRITLAQIISRSPNTHCIVKDKIPVLLCYSAVFHSQQPQQHEP